MKAAARANGWHDDGLGHYLRSIRRYDMLSLEDEQSLARRWRDNKDSDAADKLVTSHLRLERIRFSPGHIRRQRSNLRIRFLGTDRWPVR